MSSDSREERERLKEEYKEHYRKMHEAKERLAGVQKKKNIVDALNNMDTSPLMETFDDFLIKIKSKIAHVEARLDVAMDSLVSDEDDFENIRKSDEELRKEQAKETLRQAKIEMGLLYSEIERQADAVKVEKTIGTKEYSAGESEQETDRSEPTRGSS